MASSTPGRRPSSAPEVKQENDHHVTLLVHDNLNTVYKITMGHVNNYGCSNPLSLGIIIQILLTGLHTFH